MHDHDKDEVKNDPGFGAECKSIVAQFDNGRLTHDEAFSALGSALHRVLMRFDAAHVAKP